MRRDLRIPIAAMAVPPEVVLEAFDPAKAGVCRDLMNRAYGEAGDEPVPVGAWYNTMVGDPQYDPSLVWVATSRSAVIGFCQCWRVPFVKDLVVESGWRRRGNRISIPSPSSWIFPAACWSPSAWIRGRG